MVAHLSLSLLGPFRATLDGEPIAGLEAAKERALLAYVAVEAHRHPEGHPRIALAERLWPERSDRVALANLRNALAGLRRAVGDRPASASRDAAHLERARAPFLLVTRETIQFNLAGDYWLDVDAFRALVETPEAGRPDHERLEEAVALYRGDFLDGVSVRDSADFEDWALLLRERLQRQALAALRRLVAHYESRVAVARACEFAWRQVELAPWEEEAHRGLMRLLALSGQRGAALAQYEACRRALRDELDVEPGEETTRLYERIRDGAFEQEGVESQPQVPERQALPRVSPALRAPAPAAEPLAPAPVPSAEGRPLGERRMVTALTAVVALSSAQGGAVDVESRAELRAEVMRHLLPILGSEIDRHGGEVDRYRDDGLIALFGASATHEDDPERAVLAALAMQEAFQPHVAEWAAREQVALSLCVGIGSGEVVAGSVGDRALVWADSVVERALGLAEPAQGAANHGAVRVAEETYRRVAALFEWELPGEITAKEGGPAAAYGALARRAAPGKGRGIAGLASPLVGREAELQALREALDRLRSGIGGIVTVVGEAGIGKSRLVAECRGGMTLRQAQGRLPPLRDDGAALNWVEGRCLSYAAGSAYHLWLDMLDRWLGVAPDAPPTAVRQALRERVQSLCPDRFADVYPYLARMMALPLEEELDAGQRGLDAESLRFLTFRAVETLLTRAAAERPLVVLCEDLHWADPTSLALLEHLLALTERAPILLVCLFRPQTERRCWQVKERAARDYPHAHTDLWLKPLSPAQSLTLVGNLLHPLRALREDLPPALRARILDRAEGNPFYVEELLRSLIDAAADGGAGIVHDPATHRWRATRDVADLPLPGTLHGVLSARIDRLPGETKRVLQLASVIGRAFAYPVLSAIHSPPAPPRSREAPREPEAATGGSPADPDLLSHLVALERAQLVREQARLPEREYVFKHVLTQEAAYASLLRRERRTAHRRVAEALERLDPGRGSPGRGEGQLGLLAHHWERAGEIERAVGYLQRAGEQAAAQYANDEALDYFMRALEWVPERAEAGSHPELTERRYALLLAREAIYDMQGKREAQRRDLEALAALVEAGAQDGQKAVVASRQARYAAIAYDHPRAMAMAQETVRLARAAGDAACEATGERQWAWVCGRLRDHEAARLHAERALALAQGAGLRQEEARYLNALGTVVRYTPHGLAAARAYYERALDIYRQIGDLRGEGEVLHELAFAVGVQGDYDQAAVHLERALHIYREIGDRRGEIWATRLLGTRCAHVGDYVAAKSYIEQALRIAREMSDLVFEGETLDRLGRLAWRLGDYAAARSYLERALRIARDTGKPVPGSPLTSMALIWHALGDDEAAYGYACQEPLLSDRVFSGDRETVLGHTLLGLGRPDEAADAYRQALAMQREGDRHHLTVEPLAGLARVALAQGDHTRAVAHAEEILRQLQLHPKLEGTQESLRIYLTCYQVLRAVDDPRAQEVLEAAHRLLQERAGWIDDEDLRRSYLENVPAHREIVAAWHGSSPSPRGAQFNGH